jgi:hypothetical protein
VIVSIFLAIAKESVPVVKLSLPAMHNNASSTKLSLRLPIQEVLPMQEKADRNGSSLFGHLASLISRDLALKSMSLDLSKSNQYLRLTFVMTPAEAVKMHEAAHRQNLETGNWVANLLAQTSPGDPIAGRSANRTGLAQLAPRRQGTR